MIQTLQILGFIFYTAEQFGSKRNQRRNGKKLSLRQTKEDLLPLIPVRSSLKELQALILFSYFIFSASYERFEKFIILPVPLSCKPRNKHFYLEGEKKS